jgi:hypothetical protein
MGRLFLTWVVMSPSSSHLVVVDPFKTSTMVTHGDTFGRTLAAG